MRTVSTPPQIGEFQVCDECFHERRDQMFEHTFNPGIGETCALCNAFQDARPGDALYSPHLFSLTEAAQEISQAKGAGPTTAASAKFAGKLLANTTVIAAKLGWKFAKELPVITAKMAAEVAKEAAKK
ncbi:hypothetical protein [Dyella japonica]|uniref:Uncharacterized protein n=1 Tax=Dyella japonica A8 TaxID=1217721 RepID=A0A075JXZ2_9GAMM|nr:hypothetical protein [Dyella japonica]AIF46337.1 hypothetical protein HY57_03240 [Dyella japonica A8]